MPGPAALSGYKARYVSTHAAAAPSTDANRPQGSLFAIAGVGFGLMEAGFWDTSANAKNMRFVRMTAAGTPGAGQTESKYDPDMPAASCTVFTTHTAAGTIGDNITAFRTPGASGLGWMDGYHDQPVEVKSGTANGVAFIVSALALGTADVYFVWEE